MKCLAILVLLIGGAFKSDAVDSIATIVKDCGKSVFKVGPYCLGYEKQNPGEYDKCDQPGGISIKNCPLAFAAFTRSRNGNIKVKLVGIDKGPGFVGIVFASPGQEEFLLKGGGNNYRVACYQEAGKLQIRSVRYRTSGNSIVEIVQDNNIVGAEGERENSGGKGWIVCEFEIPTEAPLDLQEGSEQLYTIGLFGGKIDAKQKTSVRVSNVYILNSNKSLGFFSHLVFKDEPEYVDGDGCESRLALGSTLIVLSLALHFVQANN